MTNSKYKAHTDPLFKNLKLQKNDHIFCIVHKFLVKICKQFYTNILCLDVMLTKIAK